MTMMNLTSPTELDLLLSDRISRALTRVYDLHPATPLEPFELSIQGAVAYLKREDTSVIRSYKWRGAYFKMIQCVESGNRGPFVTASSGNHAQGVALAANRLGVPATIFMPVSTPELKQRSVKKLGGTGVSVVLTGDSLEQASRAAADYLIKTAATLIPPFDDLDVIAGQATIAHEVLGQLPDVDVIFVPIGGGGLASGVSHYCQAGSRQVQVIGVEVLGQDSMRTSIEAGWRTRLDPLDLFCDGTAVNCPGELTFEICRRHLSRIVTVTNEQVCAAIATLWESRRLITEPSGAVALAGLIASGKSGDINPARQKCVAIVSGGNTDFRTLPMIVQRSQQYQS